MIDGMLQQGTDAALDDQLRRPAPRKPVEPPVFGTDFFTAPFRGIGGGTAKSMAFGAEITGAFGQVLAAGGTDSAGGMFSLQSTAERQSSERARSVVLKTGPTMSNPVGDTFRQRAVDILPDPQTASKSAQVTAGLADFATRAVGYTVALGPVGPMAFGGDTALEESDRLKQQGVDMETRTKAGALVGAINAAAVAVPMGGATAARRFVAGTAVGEGAMVGQAVAERAILKAAGYDHLAESFDPLDPVNLALGVVPGALGAKFGGKPMRVPKTEADMRVAAALTPEEQARSMAYETSPANLASLESAIKAEKRADVKATLQGELDKLRAQAGEHGVAAAVKADPEIVAAARVSQVVDAVDASRLTPDTDLAGRDAHLSAVELAHDQLASGQQVEVAHVLRPLLADDVHPFDSAFLHDEFNVKADSRAYTMGTVEAVAEAQRLVGLQRLEQIAGERLSAVKPDERWSAAEAAQIEMAARKVVDFYDQPAARTKMAEARPLMTAAAAEALRATRERIESPTKVPPEPTTANPVDSKAPAEPAGTSQERPNGKGEGEGTAAVDRAAQEAAGVDPDMLVHLEGMEAPMKVGELLARIKEEAANDVRDGKLLEVAAACDLRS